MSSAATAKRDDGWVRVALTDDTVVAELLLRMKHSAEEASPPEKMVQILAPPPGWGARLPRSRPSFLAASRCDASSDSRRKELSDSTRRSPTTPLSWSGGSGGDGSPSAATDGGFEESSSGRRSSSAARSKIIGANDISSIISGRSRKKSFTELKDEESLLLKERISLKKEISTLRSTCREQRVTNENLKKMKLDLNSYSDKKSTAYDEQQKATSGQPQLAVWPSLPRVSSTLVTQPTCLDHSQSQPDCHEAAEKAAGSSRDNPFLLPDLNMMPCEDDFGLETLYGMS